MERDCIYEELMARVEALEIRLSKGDLMMGEHNDGGVVGTEEAALPFTLSYNFETKAYDLYKPTVMYSDGKTIDVSGTDGISMEGTYYCCVNAENDTAVISQTTSGYDYVFKLFSIEAGVVTLYHVGAITIQKYI